MEEKAVSQMEALITIVDSDLGNLLKSFYKRNQIPLYLQSHGYGSAESEIYELLGFGNPKKTIVLSILSAQMTRRVLNQLREEIEFHRPGTGIAFTVSLNSFSSSLWKLCQEMEQDKAGTEREDPSMEVEVKEAYDLIVTIVNRGHSDLVMTAAKAAGAPGGTLIHGLGLGSKEAEKFLGITIQPEKDVILILAPRAKKAGIMEEIAREAGLNTVGRGICFSLPVNATLGLKTQA
ncbi:MAG: hypothetical protein GX081_05055 [Firmicutes bacterium]|nr:hypothetical protein [Bacillota bacterium]